jgi:ribonuclease III
MDNRFSENPYNLKNKLILSQDIIDVMNKLNINEYKINNLSIYQTAYVHTSYTNLSDYRKYKNTNNSVELFNNSYETLEFLGDSILGSVVSSYLYKRYYVIHNQNEGFLTKMKNNIVNGETLAKLSKLLGFEDFMIISKYIDDDCNGRTNNNILEDIFEAFIGAIYLDNGYLSAETFILSVIESYIDFGELIITDKNYKDQLLRYYQNNYKESPKYLNTYNESNKTYTSKLINSKIAKTIYGSGISKKKSEQELSKLILIEYGLLSK